MVPWNSLGPMDLVGRVRAFCCSAKIIVDWGCGLNHSPISSQVVLLDCEKLISIDAWRDYLETIKDRKYAAKKHHCVLGDVAEVAKELREDKRLIDLSLCLDIVEHLEKPAALEFLGNLEAISKNVLIWVPLGYAPIDKDTYGGNNHALHTHRSTWAKEEFEEIGYEVEALEHFHTPMFGHRVDGGWCYKSL